MLIGQVQQTEIFGKVSVTEPEERAYYAAHQEGFTTPASITLREILISVPDAQGTGSQASSAGVDEEARAKAEAARARVLAGEDFVRVAGEVSDAPSKANGGQIGPLSREDLTPELQELLRQSSRSASSARSFARIGATRFSSSKASMTTTVQPFEAVREQIAQKVFDEKRQGEMEKYLKKLRAEAIIEWKQDDSTEGVREGHRRPGARGLGPERRPDLHSAHEFRQRG